MMGVQIIVQLFVIDGKVLIKEFVLIIKPTEDRRLPETMALKKRGGYLTFVDNDDWIEPEMYERLVEKAIEYNTDITGCATLTEFENGTLKNAYYDLETGIVNKNTCILNILYQTVHSWGTVWNKIFKKEIFNNIQFPEGMQLEDYVVIIKLFNEANGIFFINKPMYHYMSRTGSQSKRAFYLGKLTIIEAAEQIKCYLLENNTSKELRYAVNSFVIRMYADVLWDVHKSNFKDRKSIVNNYRSSGMNLLRYYLLNSDKRLADIKVIVKLFLSIII